MADRFEPVPWLDPAVSRAVYEIEGWVSGHRTIGMKLFTSYPVRLQGGFVGTLNPRARDFIEQGWLTILAIGEKHGVEISMRTTTGYATLSIKPRE